MATRKKSHIIQRSRAPHREEHTWKAPSDTYAKRAEQGTCPAKSDTYPAPRGTPNPQYP